MTERILRVALQAALDALDSEDTPQEDRFTISLDMTGRRFPVGDDFPDVNFTLDVPDPEEERVIRFRVEAPRSDLIHELHGRAAQIYRIDEGRDRFETSSRWNWETDGEGVKKTILVTRYPFLNRGSNFHIRV